MTSYIAMVTNVVDGDTFDISYGSATKRIRLANINTAERGALGALQATTALQQLINGKTINVQETGRITFGRSEAHVWVGSIYVNQEMVNRGYSNWIE